MKWRIFPRNCIFLMASVTFILPVNQLFKLAFINVFFSVVGKDFDYSGLSEWIGYSPQSSAVVVVDFGSWVFTPLFEMFISPFSFCLANSMQRIGWGYPNKKSKPRLQRQTGVNQGGRTWQPNLPQAHEKGN